MRSLRSQPSIRSRLRAIVGVVALAVAVPAVPAVAGKAEEAAALVDEGKAYFRDRNYKEAFTRFRAAHALDKSNVNALYNAALAARKGGLLDDARAAYQDLLAISNNDLDAVYGLAEVERALAHNDDARKLYERYVADEKRPERQDLVARARDALLALPTAVPPTPTPALTRSAVPAVPDVDVDAAFAAGVAHQKAERFADAAQQFALVVEHSPGRSDALLKLALMRRKLASYPEARAAYTSALSSTSSTAEQKLDALYGLAETARLAGDRTEALALFQRYVSEEKRESEAKFVARAREHLAALSSTPSPPATPATTTPATTTPATTVASTPPATTTPAATVALTTPPAVAASFVDDALRQELLARAGVLDGRGDGKAAAALRAQAASLTSPQAAPSTSTATTPCDADRLLADGEIALANGNAAVALVAFRRARVCAPTRAAPLWGLSRAFDVVGAKKQGRHLAAKYAESDASDRDPTFARDAAWRAAQPD